MTDISVSPIGAAGTDSFYQNALLCAEQGKIIQAIESLHQAIIHQPLNAEAHYQLGRLYGKSGKPLLAIHHFQIASEIVPDAFIYWLGLARAFIHAKRFGEAAEVLHKIKSIKYDDPELWALYAALFEQWQENLDLTPQIIEDIGECIMTPWINPVTLKTVTHMLFIHQPIVKIIQGHISNYTIPEFKNLLLDKTLNWASLNHQAFIGMLTRFFLTSLEIEKVLISMRSEILFTLTDTNRNKQVLESLENLLPFISALAGQCFINEYVYPQSAEEVKSIQKLEAKAINSPSDLEALEFAILACYRPIGSLQNSFALGEIFFADKNAGDIVTQQILEPALEQKLRNEIQIFTSIENDVSLQVREQYEEFPYPRWVRTAIWKRSTLQEILHYLFPHLSAEYFSAILHDNLQILVAGCGTGKQPIENALSLSNVEITAIDISLSSLAYCLRKIREYKIENITLGLGDLLKCNELGKKFEAIYCGGVLHHLNDPMEGWRALEQSLKPGGFMMIALYSDIARRYVVKVRDFIAQNGYNNDAEGIRSCREFIKTLPHGHPMRPKDIWHDFYTTSSCRDLLFHVREHRFTPKRLKQSIAELGLEFLGFQFLDNNLLTKYIAFNPSDPRGLDLDAWEIFEQQNPDSFIGMYQFWVYKPEATKT